MQEQFRTAGTVTVAFLQRGSGRQQTPARAAATHRWNYRQRGQTQQSLDIVGRVDAVVEIFEKQRQPDSERQRQHQRQHHRTHSRRTDGAVRLNCIIDYRDIIRPACEYYIVLFRPLQQAVQQSLISVYFLLRDAIVDCGFVLGKGFRSLLIERLAQSLFARQGLSITCLKIRQQDARTARTRLTEVLLQLGNLLLNFLNLGRLFGGIDQQLGPLLFQIRQL